MKADFKVVLDACVLTNFAVCDLLLRLAERPRLYLPIWSTAILEEVRRTQVKKLDWPEELADSFREALQKAFPEATVDDYQSILPSLTNDKKDRHVLATAIRSGSPLILTFNLKHFPPKTLRPWSIVATHPQDYLITLYEMEPLQVASRIAAIAAKRNLDQQDVLLRLGKVLPRFASRMIDELDVS